jgi:hypothetical protein
MTREDAFKVIAESLQALADQNAARGRLTDRSKVALRNAADLMSTLTSDGWFRLSEDMHNRVLLCQQRATEE